MGFKPAQPCLSLSWRSTDVSPSSFGRPQLDFGGAECFFAKFKSTVQRVELQGGDYLVKVTPDGNCFFGATTLAVLLGAVCDTNPEVIQGVAQSFRDAVESSGKNAYSGLSEEMKVSLFIGAPMYDRRVMPLPCS